jgi:drug/metabolite transporter (DMT)-like permease
LTIDKINVKKEELKMSQARGEFADRMRHKGLAFCRCPMSRSGRIVFGIVLTAVGAFWLALKLGWIPAAYDSAVIVFWPLMMILIGSWIIVKTVARRKSYSERPDNRT